MFSIFFYTCSIAQNFMPPVVSLIEVYIKTQPRLILVAATSRP